MFRKIKKKNWQNGFIKEVFDSSNEKQKSYSKSILQRMDLLYKKNDFLPQYLFKYYSPTSQNILDIKNQRLWMAHPNFFNDPFDCNIGYDRVNFEKRKLIQIINEIGCVDHSKYDSGFTIEEKDRIMRSKIEDISYWNSSIESYSDAKRKVLDNKSNDFKKNINRRLDDATQEIDDKVGKLKNIDIRVACFSNFDRYDEFYKQIVMWSHYADNHRGFCVEYDLSFLKPENNLKIPDRSFYDDKDKYLNERNQAIIRAGIFPVEYTAKRINIPFSKLEKIKIKSSGNIFYNSNIDELIYKTFLVKSANWNYEKEWRIIVDENICKYYENKIPFPYIKAIYLGSKADNELINTMIDIGKEINAEVIIVKMDGQKFILESDSTWSYEYDREKSKSNDPYSRI
ncbi:DUF2971 domain-containing protein [Flavobacterium sp. Arc2]|uniref:DUF2971 domain-containing protein n=1 Tax=Flavobacterium sp. Arc2 TaxID=3046685 RepID=UPI00352F6B0A